ncbi:hypothetical protein [Gordonia sp. (in: high G+C Gram-positive bacteria)]|uniref:hypothetical protein n=1 Tax=Gordonia sp. (in: high G+C Gram-positive bacteria) TaxID=84139 RepID=UPI003C7676CC
MISRALAAIVQTIAADDPAVREQILEILGPIADDAHAAVEATLEDVLSAQVWGTKVHKAFENLVDEMADQIAEVLGEGFNIHTEESIEKGRSPRIGKDGSIDWEPRGTPNTIRPDVIVTQLIDGVETLVLIVDLKTGKAGISKAWARSLRDIFSIPGEKLGDPIQELRPSLPRPTQVYDEEKILWQ